MSIGSLQPWVTSGRSAVSLLKKPFKFSSKASHILKKKKGGGLNVLDSWISKICAGFELADDSTRGKKLIEMVHLPWLNCKLCSICDDAAILQRFQTTKGSFLAFVYTAYTKPPYGDIIKQITCWFGWVITPIPPVTRLLQKRIAAQGQWCRNPSQVTSSVAQSEMFPRLIWV